MGLDQFTLREIKAQLSILELITKVSRSKLFTNKWFRLTRRCNFQDSMNLIYFRNPVNDGSPRLNKLREAGKTFKF